jgi:hypothetical protein
MDASKKLKMAQLKNLLKPMDLPSYRKFGETPDNLRWLAKNLAVRNANHRNFGKAIEVIEQILS